MRCPHSHPDAVKQWLRLQLVLLGAPIPQVMEGTGVLDRRMPEDFIDAVFAEGGPARRVLVDLLSRFDDQEALELLPEEEALVIRSRRATMSIRPAQDGVFVALSMGQSSDGAKSVVRHIQADHPGPRDVLETMGVAASDGK
jgi:hypothetical protein